MLVAADVITDVPQWSQPEIGWVTSRVLRAGGVEPAAAMEPAGDRLGDGTIRRLSLSLLSTPQWSQPEIGWVTAREI